MDAQLQQMQQKALDAQLQPVAERYAYVQRVRHDMALLLHANPSLHPHVGPLVPNGPSLLVVNGTVPITYRGQQYHIPLQIVLPEGYPYSSPLCRVTPTQAMVIKAKHKHVDSSGICYLPYLSEWRPETSSLVLLVQELRTIFTGDPPVRAKPAIKHSKTTPSMPPGSFSSDSPIAFPAPASMDNSQRTVPNSLPAVGQQPPPPYNDAREKIKSMLHRRYDQWAQIVSLEDEKERISKELGGLERMLSEVEGTLKKIENDKIDIDAATNPKNPTQLLLISLRAEDAGIEDTMHSLMTALTRETVDTATYLRLIRKLARDQFLVRARIKKLTTP